MMQVFEPDFVMLYARDRWIHLPGANLQRRLAGLQYLWIGLGGFIGANARYLLQQWVANRWGANFPYGTLLANVGGSFAIAFFLTLTIGRLTISPEARLFVAAGFLGGFTTFSSFAYETFGLVGQNGWGLPRLILSAIFGAHSRIHTATIVDLSADLPLVIEWVDSPARVVERVMPRLREMVAEGLVTVHEVEVVTYSYRRLRELPLAAPVHDVMSRQVHTARPDTPLAEAVGLLLDKVYRTLPVVDEHGRVVGILTDGDLLGRAKLLATSAQRELSQMETDGCGADGVSVASGCWVGRRTMRIFDYRKVAATFVDTLIGQAARVTPRPGIRKAACCYAPAAPDRWTAQLKEYQLIPEAEDDRQTFLLSLKVQLPRQRDAGAGDNGVCAGGRGVHHRRSV